MQSRQSAILVEVAQRTAEPQLASCPICDSDRLEYAFHAQGGTLVDCKDCGLLMRNPQPSDETLAQHPVIAHPARHLGKDRIGKARRTARVQDIEAAAKVKRRAENAFFVDSRVADRRACCPNVI